MTKITLEICYGTYSISVPKDDLDIYEIGDELLIPLSWAAGVHPDVVDKLFGGDNA